MPRYLHDGACVLNVLGLWVIDHCFNGPANQSHIPAPVVRFLIPRHLQNSRASRVQVFHAPTMNDVVVVHVVDNVMQHVLKIICHRLKVRRFRHQLHFGHTLHLLCHAVVHRVRQRVQLQRFALFFVNRPRILLGVFQPQHLAHFPRLVVIVAYLTLPRIKAGVYLFFQLFVLVGQRLRAGYNPAEFFVFHSHHLP